MTQPWILCGTDLGAAARGAADVAAALAVAMGARLELVHVLDDGAAGADPGRALADTTAAVDAEVDRLASAYGVPVTRNVLAGRPAARLAELASDARFVVVAAAGLAPSMFRIGGTAERVAQAARVPVLIVRDPRPLLAWLQGGLLSVAALVGDDAASDHVLDWLRVLRQVAPFDLTVLQAYYPDDAARRFGVRPGPLVVADPELEGYLRRDLRAHIGDLGGRGAVEVQAVLALGRQADHLLDHPAAAGAALVVVGNHRRRGIARLSSVASGVVHLAGCSLLVVPVDERPAVEAPWPRLRRVLVATDLSPFAVHAVRHAYGLAAAEQGEVVLVHVVPLAGGEGAVADSQAALLHLVPASPPPGVVTALETVRAADAAEAIVQVAARVAADCIVIASHGRSGVRRLVLGSVAQAVVHGADRPVLVVRPPDDA